MIEQLEVLRPYLVPELRLWLLPTTSPLWREGVPEELGWPYWAFAWPGGQVLARYVLDVPSVIRGKRVVSFGAGGAIEAVAAMKAGATSALCTDLDPVAGTVAQRNATLNDVQLETTLRDVIGVDVDADVLLVGDACYEPALAARVVPWLRSQAARGVDVLVGDPGRVQVDALGEVLATYDAPFDGDPDGATLWRTTVTRVRYFEATGVGAPVSAAGNRHTQ